MSYGLYSYVNNKVSTPVLLIYYYYYLTVLQLDIKKKENVLPIVFISALGKIGMVVKNQSADFLFIFSRLWYTHVIRIRGCN